MTVAELQAELQAAIDRGLPPETTVVLGSDIGWFVILEKTEDPTNSECDMWFTLIPGEGDEWEADSRFTPGGLPDEVRERLEAGQV